MRLLNLDVEAFGVFRNQDFDFGSGRFQLICGPNEAGKSTLLQAIRETLFGFPHQTQYQLFDDEMAATAKLVFNDGRELRFRRRKGRKQPVAGELADGAIVDEQGLNALLGANLPLFQSVFAFSLEELSSGQKSLEQAQLTEALFGGAIGGLSKFQKLQRRMTDEASRLYTPRATKRPINAIIQQAETLQQRLESTAAEPADFRQLRERHRALEQGITKLDRQMLQLRDVHQEAKRMCEAWGPFQELIRLRHQRPGDGELALTAEQWEDAKRIQLQRQQLRENIERQVEAIARRQSQHRELTNQSHDEILAQQANLHSLQQETGRMQDFVEQLPPLRREHQEATHLLHERLRSLDVAWSIERLQQVPEDHQLQKRLLDAARDLIDRRRQLDEIVKQERAYRKQLQDVQKRLQEGPSIVGESTEMPRGNQNWEDDGEHEGEDGWGEILEHPFSPTQRIANVGQDAHLETNSATQHDETNEPSHDQTPAGASSEQSEHGSSAFQFLDDIGAFIPEGQADTGAETSTWESLDDLIEALESQTGDEDPPQHQSPCLDESQRTALEQLLSGEAKDLESRSHLAAIQKRSREIEARRKLIEEKMRACGESWDWSEAPPDGSRLDELQKQWDSLLQQRRATAASLAELVANAENLAARDHELSAHAPPDDAALKLLRTLRDEAWSIIVRHFVDGAAQQQLSHEQFQCDVEQLVERYPSLVRAADEAADVRQDQASTVAEMTSRRQAIQQNRSQQANAQLRAAKVEETVTQLQAQWQQIWPHGPQPGNENISDWFRWRLDRDELTAELNGLIREETTLAGTIDDYERRCRAAVDLPSDVGIETLRTEIRERLRRHQRWLDQRDQLLVDRDKLQAQHEEATRDMQRLTVNVRQAEMAWADLREQMRLPDSWQADVVAVNVADINAAKAVSKRIVELDEKSQAMTREVEAFRARVERIAGDDAERNDAEQADRPVDRSAVERLNRLSQQLAEAQTSRQKLSASQAEEKRLNDERLRLETELKKADQRWTELKVCSGAASEEAFVAALDGASVHQQLKAAEAQVHTALACDDNDRRNTLMAELETSSENQLRQRLEHAQRNLQQVDQQRSQLHRDEGAARERLQQVDDSDAAALVEMERQSTLAELSEAVDRWAPLVLASRLMEHALKRFEREHQPALLSDVADFFRRMTGNRYVDVKRQLGQSKSLMVITDQGKAKMPSQLSTGTREQLYLAIRLAYVRKYCQSSEPLPLVMDDVLVNFDEARAQATIDVLMELSDEIQVLLMTCHRRTARMLHQRFPDMQPILLTNDPGESLDHWIAEEEHSPSGIKRSRPRCQTSTASQADGPTQGQLFPKG